VTPVPAIFRESHPQTFERSVAFYSAPSIGRAVRTSLADVMSGLVALVVRWHSSDVSRMIRVWFNVAQFMLAVGIGGLAYRAAGGCEWLQHFQLVSFHSSFGSHVLVIKPR